MYKFSPRFIDNMVSARLIADAAEQLLYLQFCEKCYEQILIAAENATIGDFQDVLKLVNPPELSKAFDVEQIERLKKMRLPEPYLSQWTQWNGDTLNEREAKEILDTMLGWSTTEIQSEIDGWVKSLRQLRIEIGWREKQLTLVRTRQLPAASAEAASGVHRKIRWTGTQPDLVHLFVKLSEEGLIDKSTIDEWAATAEECFLVKGKPLKSASLRKVKSDSTYKPKHGEEIDGAFEQTLKK